MSALCPSGHQHYDCIKTQGQRWHLIGSFRAVSGLLHTIDDSDRGHHAIGLA